MEDWCFLLVPVNSQKVQRGTRFVPEENHSEFRIIHVSTIQHLPRGWRITTSTPNPSPGHRVSPTVLSVIFGPDPNPTAHHGYKPPPLLLRLNKAYRKRVSKATTITAHHILKRIPFRGDGRQQQRRVVANDALRWAGHDFHTRKMGVIGGGKLCAQGKGSYFESKQLGLRSDIVKSCVGCLLRGGSGWLGGDK
ncbi:hypothetical protein K504DRAFT_503464 [Pleomassaria siparia CBS 279.74]|uniref:Uncharacterized protein n=1 Tax=Pleomassaria siparia CBS 279.74 TaxID=1314801 RepID=A0A6G1K745_9PLEO|nr:hypothetical protein K504DRAFT_503464 [Pleomassaria siparia CBS 279.74]